MLYTAPSLAGEETVSVEGAFTEFMVEHEAEDIVAVHFSVGETRVVADAETSIFIEGPGFPAVLLSLAEFSELAEQHDLTGAVDGVSGDEVLFARTIAIDPPDFPGDPVTVSGPFTDFDFVFAGDDLVAVHFLVGGFEVEATGETRIVRPFPQGEVLVSIEAFAELAMTLPLSGTVTGEHDGALLHAVAILLDPLPDPDPDPVVLEGPFTDFEEVVEEGELVGVHFRVDGAPALAHPDTLIVVNAPTAAALDHNQLTLRQFLHLGTVAEIAGRVAGHLSALGVVRARHVRIDRIARPDQPVEVAGVLRGCQAVGENLHLRVQLAHSDRVLDVVVSPETRLFFFDDEEHPIDAEELARLCEGELVVKLHAKGVLLPTDAGDAVLLLASVVVFEYVEARVHGRFQGGEVDLANGIIGILIAQVRVTVTPQTLIELEGDEIGFEAFAALVQANEPFLARAAGALRKNGGIQAFELSLREIDPPIDDIAGRLLGCEGEDPVRVSVAHGDVVETAVVNGDTRLAEVRGDAIAALTLEEFLEACRSPVVYRFFGVGPQADPLILAHALISKVRVQRRGVFAGGEIAPDLSEIVINLSETAVRVVPETHILDPNHEPVSFEAFAALVQAGERHHAGARGVLLEDGSVIAGQLRLREADNIKLFKPVDATRELLGFGAAGVGVDVFGGDMSVLLGQGTVGVDGIVRVTAVRPLAIGETVIPVALGIPGQPSVVTTEGVFSSSFE